MAKATKAEATKAKAEGVAAYKYTGGHPSTKVWDGQTVEAGKKFTPKDASCAAKCEASPYFKKA